MPTLKERLRGEAEGGWVDCWECGGEGLTFDCLDGCCVNAEVGCDDCAQRCQICRGKGGWYSTGEDEP